MSIQEAWVCNIRQHGKGFDPDWEPLPGDAICDTQDAKGTYGLIIAVLPKVKDATQKVLVLWTRDLQLSTMDKAVNHIAGQIRDEIDADILHDIEAEARARSL